MKLRVKLTWLAKLYRSKFFFFLIERITIINRLGLQSNSLITRERTIGEQSSIHTVLKVQEIAIFAKQWATLLVSRFTNVTFHKGLRYHRCLIPKMIGLCTVVVSCSELTSFTICWQSPLKLTWCRPKSLAINIVYLNASALTITSISLVSILLQSVSCMAPSSSRIIIPKRMLTPLWSTATSQFFLSVEIGGLVHVLKTCPKLWLVLA